MKLVRKSCCDSKSRGRGLGCERAESPVALAAAAESVAGVGEPWVSAQGSREDADAGPAGFAQAWQILATAVSQEVLRAVTRGDTEEAVCKAPSQASETSERQEVRSGTVPA